MFIPAGPAYAKSERGFGRFCGRDMGFRPYVGRSTPSSTTAFMARVGAFDATFTLTSSSSESLSLSTSTTAGVAVLSSSSPLRSSICTCRLALESASGISGLLLSGLCVWVLGAVSACACPCPCVCSVAAPVLAVTLASLPALEGVAPSGRRLCS